MNNLTVIFKGSDIKLTDVDYHPAQPAKLFGLPENCFPEEPAEIYFKIDTGFEPFNDFLDNNYWKYIEELAMTAAVESAQANKEEIAEHAYDEMKDKRMMA